MPFCPSCGSPLPAGATTCPKCAGASQAAAGATPAAGVPAAAATGMPDNIAGMLAYLFIPAIVFLVVEPYNRNRFVRFHSFQAILTAVVFIVLGIALGIVVQVPFLGWAIGFLVFPLIGLAEFILWIILLLKAFQGQMFKLPIVGDMAEKQANA